MNAELLCVGVSFIAVGFACAALGYYRLWRESEAHLQRVLNAWRQHTLQTLHFHAVALQGSTDVQAKKKLPSA